MAGRSMSAMVRRQNFEHRHEGGRLLPADNAHIRLRRSCTASMARHMEDFHRPRRSAWLGLSSMPTEMSQWWKSERSATSGVGVQDGADPRFLSEDHETCVRAPFGNQGKAGE